MRPLTAQIRRGMASSRTASAARSASSAGVKGTGGSCDGLVRHANKRSLSQSRLDERVSPSAACPEMTPSSCEFRSGTDGRGAGTSKSTLSFVELTVQYVSRYSCVQRVQQSDRDTLSFPSTHRRARTRTSYNADTHAQYAHLIILLVCLVRFLQGSFSTCVSYNLYCAAGKRNECKLTVFLPRYPM